MQGLISGLGIGATEGDSKLKEWKCVQVGHHKDVAAAIEEYQRDGWRVHTYQVTGRDIWITHYLLLERGE